MANYDAIVVGGGVVGMATAYHLVAAGVRTLLIDRGDVGRASDAGAGILSTATAVDHPDPVLRFEARAAQHYPLLIETLRAEDAGDTGYGVTGSLTVALSEDELAPFEQLRASLEHFGELGAGGYAEITPERAQTLFPPLGPVRGAIHATRGARVDGRLLVGALRRAALARGLILRTGSVDRLITGAGGVQGVALGAEVIAGGQVVIAAGAWSQAFAAELGVRIPVAPQRGQIIHLRLSGVETGDWPIVSAFRGHYMVPWPDGRIVVGATRESGTGFHPQTTALGILQVLAEALRVAPGLRDASLHEVRVGLRPACADGRPILGPVPGVGNLVLAAGHGPVGLQLGPYSGKVIAEIVSRGAPGTDLAPFALERFQGSGGGGGSVRRRFRGGAMPAGRSG
jgi:glycine/D-amino acid oxidase-like deaminating enzyme